MGGMLPSTPLSHPKEKNTLWPYCIYSSGSLLTLGTPQTLALGVSGQE